MSEFPRTSYFSSPGSTETSQTMLPSTTTFEFSASWLTRPTPYVAGTEAFAMMVWFGSLQFVIVVDFPFSNRIEPVTTILPNAVSRKIFPGRFQVPAKSVGTLDAVGVISLAAKGFAPWGLSHPSTLGEGDALESSIHWVRLVQPHACIPVHEELHL